jgi:hypothetical protein
MAENLIKQIPTTIAAAKSSSVSAGLISPKVVVSTPAGLTGQVS